MTTLHALDFPNVLGELAKELVAKELAAEQFFAAARIQIEKVRRATARFMSQHEPDSEPRMMALYDLASCERLHIASMIAALECWQPDGKAN